jgi:hypothetical protein
VLLLVVSGQIKADPPRFCRSYQKHLELADVHKLQTVKAAPDRYFNDLFTRYGHGWTGGDGTYSVLLPDSRTLWMFGDTFLGRVNPDRSRDRNSPLIHNAFVLQDNSVLVTLHGGTKKAPAALVTPNDSSLWYWPGDGTIENNRLRVFLWKFKKTGPGLWDWVWTDTDVGSFSLPAVKLLSIKPIVSPDKVLFGSAILEDGGYTFIYGTQDLKDNKYVHVARAASGDLLGQWEFFTGSHWRKDPTSSARILAGVANQFSVTKFGNYYCLITMDNRKPFGRDILAFISYSPCGPWSKPVNLYMAPEAGGDIVAYNACAHPQFTAQGKLLISYNLNHVKNFKAVFNNADLYRPKFIRADMKWLKKIGNH